MIFAHFKHTCRKVYPNCIFRRDMWGGVECRVPRLIIFTRPVAAFDPMRYRAMVYTEFGEPNVLNIKMVETLLTALEESR